MICKAHGCTNFILHAGLCQLHYRRRTRAKPLAERKQNWSEAEKQIMRENYVALGPTKMVELLRGRTAQAIRIQAALLNLKTRPARRGRPRLVQVAGQPDPIRKWGGPVNREQPMRWAA